MVKNELKTRSEFSRLAGVSAAAVTKACDKALRPACVGKRIDINHPIAAAYLQEKQFRMAQTAPATGIDPLYQAAVDIYTESGNKTIENIRKSLKVERKRAKKLVDLMRLNGVISDDPPPPPAQKQESAPRVVRGHAGKNETKKSEALRNLNEDTTIHEIPDDIEKFADMTLRELIERFGSDTAFSDWLKATKSIEDINEKRLKNAKTRGELVSRDLVEHGVVGPINTAHIKLLTDGSKTMSIRVSALINSGEPPEVIEEYIKKQIRSFIRPVKDKIIRAMVQGG